MKLTKINRTTLGMALLTTGAITLTFWRFPDKLSNISALLTSVWLLWLGVNIGEVLERNKREKLITSSDIIGEEKEDK
jgi:hypothetical protein